MSILKEMISFGRLNECFAVANGDVLIDSKFEPTMIDIRVSIKVSKKDYLKTDFDLYFELEKFLNNCTLKIHSALL
jgi:hypothetical protein